MVTQITFDETKALRYDPLGVRDPADRVIKIARLVERPEGEPTTIEPEWGGEQSFVGSYYEILDLGTGTVKYGSAATEWLNTNSRDPNVADGWYKTTPVDAYQSGAEGDLTTILADGTVETTKYVYVGDWLVRQRDGEVMCVSQAKFPTLYDIETARLGVPVA